MVTPQQELADLLTERQLKLLRVSVGVERKITRLIRKYFDRVISDIATRRKPAKAEMKTLVSVVTDLLADLPKDLSEAIGVEELVKSEMEHTAIAINSALGASVVPTTVAASAAVKSSQEAIIQGTPVAEWLQEYSDRLKKEIVREIRLGVAGGSTIPKTAERLEILLGVKSSTASTLARTLTLGVTNHARQSYYDQYADKLIQGYIHDATLDSRTTKTCAVRDGLAWDKNKQPVGHSQLFAYPPLHPNCRSQIVPWLYSADELPKKDRAKLSQGTRASMDGQVPATRDFQEFLDRKPEAWKEEWLGPGRYKLYKEGKIGFQDLVDPRGRPLTLEELKNI